MAINKNLRCTECGRPAHLSNRFCPHCSDLQGPVEPEPDDSEWEQKKTAGTVALVALVGFVLLWIFGVLPQG